MQWTLVFAGCGGDEPTAPLQPCQGEIEVRVTGGTRGDISWTPRCGVSAIEVNAAPRIAMPQEMWRVLAEPGALIGPSVRYGQLPSGANEAFPAIPVEANWSYQIVLTVPGPRVAGIATWEP